MKKIYVMLAVLSVFFMISSTCAIASDLGLPSASEDTRPAYMGPVTADFSYTNTALTYQFTDKSTSSEGDIVYWEWCFDDGTGTYYGQNPEHTYSADIAGTDVDVTLYVKDNEDNSGSIVITIRVDDKAKPEEMQGSSSTTVVGGQSSSSTTTSGTTGTTGTTGITGRGGTPCDLHLKNIQHSSEVEENRRFYIWFEVEDNLGAYNTENGDQHEAVISCEAWNDWEIEFIHNYDSTTTHEVSFIWPDGETDKVDVKLMIWPWPFTAWDDQNLDNNYKIFNLGPDSVPVSEEAETMFAGSSTPASSSSSQSGSASSQQSSSSSSQSATTSLATQYGSFSL